MASLEFIQFAPMREAIDGQTVNWEHDKLARPIQRLPQLFWASGNAWAEANDWALDKATSPAGSNPKTVTALMKHLRAYADWLEEMGLDWRHFPERVADRAVVRFRGNLIDQMNRGSLRPGTATARMRAVIQFYRYADLNGFVRRRSPMWHEESVVIHYFDSVGFKRAMVRVKSDLSIPNRARPGMPLEDGLTPLRGEHMQQLLAFTAEEGLEELHWMLSLGFFTGARIGTITSLRVANIEQAMPDLTLSAFYRIPVGPGTGVNTKFDVSGELLIPDFLIAALRAYAYSIDRLKRQALGSPEERSLLFLTSRGNPYREHSITRLMTDLRRRAVRSRLRFMQTFKFHQSRCTYGTWLMELALRVTTEAASIAFVRDAMLHKHEATTLRYVRFLQRAPIAGAIANEFTAAFSGVRNRDWNACHA